MRNYKKYLAAALAATMVVGSSVVANAANNYVSSNDVAITDSDAASGTIGGNGEMAGTVDEDVFHVVVPGCMTGADSFNGFDFVLDPEMLISKTDAVKYISDSNAGVTGFEEDKTLYFLHKVSGTIGDTSDFVKVTNKSSIDVDIKLTPTMSDLTTITLSDTATFDDDSTSMYMAVTDGTNSTAIKADGSAEVKETIKGNKAAYDTILNASGDYEFALKADADPAGFDTYEFALTGACNGEGDWSNVTAAPRVEITWDIKPTPKEAVPTIEAGPYVYVEGQNVEIAIDLGAGDLAATDVTSITFEKDGTKELTKGTEYTFENGKLTLIAGGRIQAGREYTITMNDDAHTAFKITLE